MGWLVFDSQIAFIGDRQNMDLVLIVNECLDTWLRRRAPSVVSKTDFEKS